MSTNATSFIQSLEQTLATIKQDGLYKEERLITSPQGPEVALGDAHYINLCANNYMGLSNHPEIVKAAHEALDAYGFGLSSVRFICGTQNIHKALESELAAFLNKEDAILYSSCFDANGGLFEPLFSEEDAIISDALNHASIIDGIRLCKAGRFRYATQDMMDLEVQLKAASNARYRVIVTDGVFSMDGHIAKLPEICALAKKYNALVMVDDSHAVGFFGPKGRGTPAHFGLEKEVDIITGTFGKALGGALGGYTVASRPVIDMLRQRSRPYLFSNSLAPVIVHTTRAAIAWIMTQDDLRKTLETNTAFFRASMTEAGFKIVPGTHPIVPVMIGDAILAKQLSERLLKDGIYVVQFSYPVVPKDKARIRVQLSAVHTKPQLQKAINAFTHHAKALGII